MVFRLYCQHIVHDTCWAQRSVVEYDGMAPCPSCNCCTSIDEAIIARSVHMPADSHAETKNETADSSEERNNEDSTRTIRSLDPVGRLLPGTPREQPDQPDQPVGRLFPGTPPRDPS